MRLTAGVLAFLIAVEPGIAHAVQVAARVVVTPTLTPGIAAGAAVKNIAVPSADLGLRNLSLAPSFSLLNAQTPDAPLSLSAYAMPLQAPAVAAVAPVQSAQATPPGISGKTLIKESGALTPKTAPKPAFAERLTGLKKTLSDAVKGLSDMSAADSHLAAGRQMDALTGLQSARTSETAPSAPAARPIGGFRAHKNVLTDLKEGSASRINDSPAPITQTPSRGGIGGWFKDKVQIFREPERNRAFWRMFLGEAIYLFGFQMYVVALPFLMKSFTRNTLAENGQLRDTAAEALNAMVRENRSLARFAHWAAQAVAYIAIPLFTKDGTAGPKKWLVRSAFARMVVLFGVPAVFFASGLLSVQAALWVLLALIAGQSFFQGVYVIMMSGATARLMGHKSVLASERLRANSMRTFLSAVIAIIAPFVAGKIASLPEWFGKQGTGSAVIYGIYAASVGIAGLIFATIRIFGSKDGPEAPKEESADRTGGPIVVRGIWGAIKTAGVSMVKGVKLVWNNKFLRTLLILNLISALFADPLVFNVLPEFVESVLAANPGALDSLLSIPFLGWFFQGLVSTPMGFFALLMTSSSLGSVAASLMINPLRKLFKKIGFMTEERLTIPFYAIAFLSVPAFWLMINSGSVLGLLALYGAQTFLAGFVGMIMTGIHQKKIRGFSDLQMNQVLAANSFVSIIAAIAATLLYGFVLNDIPIATSLWIAGIATTILGVLQLISPWLLFSKEERQKKESLAPLGSENAAPGDFTGHGHEHMPNGGHGPLHIGL